jgi:hypothetical protein
MLLPICIKNSDFVTPAVKVEREKLVIASLPALSTQILDQARDHGRVMIGDMMRVTGASPKYTERTFPALAGRWPAGLLRQGQRLLVCAAVASLGCHFAGRGYDQAMNGATRARTRSLSP